MKRKLKIVAIGFIALIIFSVWLKDRYVAEAEQAYIQWAKEQTK